MTIAKVLVLWVSGVACVTVAFGQNQGAISGSVVDPSGGVVRGARVELQGENATVTQKYSTDSQGFYFFSVVKPGSYTVVVDAPGFSRLRTTDLKVTTDQKVTADLHLQIGPSSQTVDVKSDGIEVNRVDSTVGAVIGRDLVENLPLNGRSLQSLLTLVPGVVTIPGTRTSDGTSGFSVAGQRSQSNIFSIDGVSANVSAGFSGASGSRPGYNALGGTQSLVSIDELQEFRVETSSYSVEHGTSPGGQFLLTTRSGGNGFHGSAHEFVRNEVFNANDWFSNSQRFPRGDLRQNQFGGTFSGPVMIPHLYRGQNRTFFFASYEQLRLTTPITQVLDVPDSSLRNSAAAWLKPILSAFPEANGPTNGDGFSKYFQQISVPSVVHSGAIRVDQNIGSSVRVFARYNQSPSNYSSAAGRFYRADGNVNLKTFTSGVTWTLSPAAVNDFRINWTGNNSSSTTIPTVPVNLFNVFGLNPPAGANWQSHLVFQGSAGSSITLDESVSGASQNQLVFSDTFSVRVGAHELKTGVDIRRLTPTISPVAYGLNLRFKSAATVGPGIPDSFSVNSNIQAKPTFSEYGIFVSDTWKISRRITATLGIRWEANPLPGSSNGLYPSLVTGYPDLNSLKLAPAGTPLYKTTYTNVAPRGGLAIALSTKSGRETVLRLGAGTFYDTNNNAVSGAYAAYPFGNAKSIKNATYPFSASVLEAPSPSRPVEAPYGGYMYDYQDTFRLPVTYGWNAALEQMLGKRNSLTATYVGNGARRLMQTNFLGNISSVALFPSLAYISNGPTSSYNALQLQYVARPRPGTELFFAYTWSHSIDDTAIDQTSYTYTRLRGNSDADLRHVLRVGLAYEIPRLRLSHLAALVNGWGADLNLSIQSGYPFSLSGYNAYLPDGSAYAASPNLVGGVPVWLADSHVAGGYRLNQNAFVALVDPSGLGIRGNLGRNTLRGFPIGQADVAFRRTFSFNERLRLQFRAEAFNITNHPNFGGFDTKLRSSTFGVAQNSLASDVSAGLTPLTYQIGGPRSLQLALKLMF